MTVTAELIGLFDPLSKPRAERFDMSCLAVRCYCFVISQVASPFGCLANRPSAGRALLLPAAWRCSSCEVDKSAALHFGAVEHREALLQCFERDSFGGGRFAFAAG